MGTVYATAGPEAAKIAGRSPEMDAAAAKTKAVVLALAAGHTKTGNYARNVRSANVRGKNGVRDRLVETTDPAAVSIEFGHWWVTPEGKRIKWIKGLFIFVRARGIVK